jgi:hypothetical protein
MSPSIASEDQSSPIIPSDQTQGQGHWSRDDGPSADRSTHMGWAPIREVPPRVCEGALTRSLIEQEVFWSLWDPDFIPVLGHHE